MPWLEPVYMATVVRARGHQRLACCSRSDGLLPHCALFKLVLIKLGVMLRCAVLWRLDDPGGVVATRLRLLVENN